MRATYLSAAILALSLMSIGSTRADDLLAPGVNAVPQAPIGHLQPRSDSAPVNPAADAKVDDRMASFDADQARRDRELDSKLHICSHC
jgi:hypothetical protein